jgi:HAD superfamily hydrolase (TIGR01509 family)
MAIRTVVFDSDGTLMDGFKVIAGAYAHIAQLHGLPAPTKTEIRAQLAQSYPLPQILQTFFPGIPIGQLIHENNEYLASETMATYSGLETMLAELQARGLHLAIVTGGNHKIHDVLRAHNIGHYFTSIVHCDRVHRSKPDPEGFLLAMDECGSQPSEAIMVGDSPNDIFTGKNAGARYTIGITHGHGSMADLKAADPDRVVDSLPELTSTILRLEP